MKVIFVVAALVAVALAAPPGTDKDAIILRSNVDNIGIDGYNWGYETSNGIKAEEQATLNNAGTENESIAVHGSFSYIGADGITYTVNYVADENGFQPEGAHIPKTA